jgi:hypothetical protein
LCSISPLFLQSHCSFCFAVMILTAVLPESPRYLCAVGKEDQALRVLSALRDVEPSSEVVEKELLDIRTAILLESKSQSSWSGLFKDGGVSGSTRVLIGFAANFFQQMSGVNVRTKGLKARLSLELR